VRRTQADFAATPLRAAPSRRRRRPGPCRGHGWPECSDALTHPARADGRHNLVGAQSRPGGNDHGKPAEILRLAAIFPSPSPRVRGERLGQQLDCHIAPEPRVARLPDLSHPARAEGGDNLVRTNPRAGCLWQFPDQWSRGAVTIGLSSRKRSKSATSQVTSVETRAFRAHAAIRAS
jgi:hypothetical protein